MSDSIGFDNKKGSDFKKSEDWDSVGSLRIPLEFYLFHGGVQHERKRNQDYQNTHPPEDFESPARGCL